VVDEAGEARRLRQLDGRETLSRLTSSMKVKAGCRVSTIAARQNEVLGASFLWRR
jgi:hypothetical protein